MLKVKKSRIPRAGLGLFTTSRIRKGDLIVEYKGESLTWNDAKKRYGKKVNQAPYLYFVSKANCIDAARTEQELARYANDAAGKSRVRGLKNNSIYKNFRGKPFIVATRPIPRNTEILVDYGADYWREA